MLCTLSLVVLTMAPLQADPGLALDRAAEQLVPELYAVVSGGMWEKGESHGHFRVIVFSGGYEHVSSRVHLQWIEVNPDGGNLNRSVLIRELSTGFWSVGSPVFAGPRTIRVGATNPYDFSESTFTLTLEASGTYSLHELKTKAGKE
jgi:hypothetical protein